MIKKLIKGLSFKVFLISFVVQILSGFLICFFLYSRTPEMMYSPVDALDDLIDFVECQFDPVIRHPPLREIVGADLLRAA